jgi:hypothetical protein
MAAKPGRSLHPDPPDRELEAVQQRQGLGEPLRWGGKRRHRAPPAASIQHRDAEHLLVRVDPCHPVCVWFLHASLLSPEQPEPVAARGGLGPADLGWGPRLLSSQAASLLEPGGVARHLEFEGILVELQSNSESGRSHRWPARPRSGSAIQRANENTQIELVTQ